MQKEKLTCKGIWTPASLILSDLSLPQERVLSIIYGLDGGRGCVAKNQYFRPFLKGCNKHWPSKIISALEKAGHLQLEYEYFPGTKQIKTRYMKVISPLLITVDELLNDPYITSESRKRILGENYESDDPRFPRGNTPVSPEETPPFPQRKPYNIEEDSIEEEEKEKIHKKSEDGLFTPPPAGGSHGINSFSSEDGDKKTDGVECGDGKGPTVNVQTSTSGRTRCEVVAEEAMVFYEDWVKKYDNPAVQQGVRRTFRGKPTKLLRQVVGRCKKMGSDALPSFKAVIAFKCEYFAEMGIYGNINPHTILNSKFDEYLSRAVDAGWLDESGFREKKNPNSSHPVMDDMDWFQTPGHPIPEVSKEDLSETDWKIFISRQRMWADVNNGATV